MMPSDPAAAQEHADFRRIYAADEAQRFDRFLLVCASACVCMAGGQILLGFGRVALVSGLAGLGMLGIRLWGLRQSPARLRLVSQIVLFLFLLLLIRILVATGLGQSFAASLLLTLPVMAAYLSGSGIGLIWAGISVVTAAALWAAEHLLQAPGSIAAAADLRNLNRIVMILLVSAFSVLGRRASERHIRELVTSLATEQEAKRTAEQARVEAEAATQAKSTFLAMMSHELRTPLNAVVGLNGLLLDSPLSAEQRRQAELVRQSGEAMLQLVNDLLDFSKSESGHCELESLVFDPHEIVAESLELLAERAREKGLALRQAVTAPHGAQGDADRLRQILLNLLGNAVKFTEQGEVVLCCRELPGEDDRLWLRFEVQDTGMGIAPEVQAQIFQPFVQVDASTTRRFGGTGLGLAICRRLTQLMSGRIGLESRPGQGSLFWVELPFTPLPPSAWPTHRKPALVPEQHVNCTQARILVAEDNPVNQTVAAEMFKRLGCRVDIVGNGEEAVTALRHLPYDLVFMDCDMPVMDGFAATRAIRAQEGDSRHLPVIAMTAAAFKSDRDKCLEAGMDDYVAKPVRLADLERMLAVWLPDAGDSHPT